MKHKGFTLLEVLVAMIMGGLIIITVGIMLTDFNRVILRARARSSVNQEYRVAKILLTRELMRADTDFTVSAGEITFRDTGNVLVRIYRDAANRDLRINHNGAFKYLVLPDVSAVQFSYGAYSDTTVNNHLIVLEVDQEKVSSYTSAGAVTEISTQEFEIFLRNRT